MGKVSWKTIGLVLIVTLVLGWSGHFVWTQAANHQNGPLADVTWEPGSEPGLVRVTVVNQQGHALYIAYIQVTTDRGQYDGAAAGKGGVAPIKCQGTALLGIQMEKRLVLSRPLSEILGTPSIENGLEVKIVAKDMEVFDKLYSMEEKASQKQSPKIQETGPSPASSKQQQPDNASEKEKTNPE